MTLREFLLVAAYALPALAQAPKVITTGLSGPLRMILTPRGNLLVTETSREPNSGKITYVTRAGQKSTLFGKLPSGTEVVGGGSGPSALALRGRTLYIAIGAGDAERRSATPGASVLNPDGVSSPIFSSILTAEFSRDVDDAQGPYEISSAQQRSLADGFDVTLEDSAKNSVALKLLADFPDVTPDPNVRFRGSNPFSLALTADGQTLWVADASYNTITRVDTRTGRWQKTYSFPPIPNPTPVGPPVIDAVPTGLQLFEGRLIVGFLSGVPFLPSSTKVIEIDTQRNEIIPQIYGLTSVTDVLVRRNRRNIEEWFVLEFSSNQFANPAPPGRLLVYDSPTGVTVVPVLITPVSMVYDDKTNSLLILELRGQIVDVALP